MPWAIDHANLMHMFCAEKYGWTPEQVDELPLEEYIYYPVMWQAISHLQAEAHRRAQNGHG
jgi:hypothetical protein